MLYDCAMDATTTSLATKPVIKAADACQSSKPAGLNTGATVSATTPYTESCTSSTAANEPAVAVAGMLCSSHMAMSMVMMIELAPRTNPHRRMSTERMSTTRRGHWYGGRLIAKGSEVRLVNFTLRSRMPTSRMSTMEITYMRNTTRPACSRKNA